MISEIVVEYVRGKLADGCKRFDADIVGRLLDEHDRVCTELSRLHPSQEYTEPAQPIAPSPELAAMTEAAIGWLASPQTDDELEARLETAFPGAGYFTVFRAISAAREARHVAPAE